MTTVTVILFVLGFVTLIVGGEFLVRGASKLAEAFGVPPLIVGLTVVAFGTSVPEIAVLIKSAFSGQSGLVVGNVVGSNIANVLLILGLSALIAPLVVSRRLIFLEVPLMIGVSVLMMVLSLDGQLSRFDGAILMVGFLLHLTFMIREQRGAALAVENLPGETDSIDSVRRRRSQWIKNVLLVVAGLVVLVIGSEWLVDGAVAMARTLGVSELVIGLTVVAVGTSLPEMATSIIAGLRGQRDIAVGNVVGSNIFNILSGLGLTALIAPAGIEVSDGVLSFDLPIMIATAVACLPIFFTGHRIARWEGAMFFGYYIAYAFYLILTATRNQAAAQFRAVMLWFVIPLTVTTLLIFLARTFREDKRRVDAA
jgi:cation:H+ antiporter